MDLTMKIDAPTQLVVFGPYDKFMKHLISSLKVQITARGSTITISSDNEKMAQRAHRVLKALINSSHDREYMTVEEIDKIIDQVIQKESPLHLSHFLGSIVPRTDGQAKYIQTMMDNDLVFCFGPAGSGKTFLAVALAVSMYKKKAVSRIILVRPAVESGEKLGFLPGDISAKVNPYLQPLFDAMSVMMTYDKFQKLVADDTIEVAPLAFMRGRTLDDAVVILDEAQNSTKAQMLMFLTRMGTSCKMIVTGDATQIDLPSSVTSGLADAVDRLKDIEGVGVAILDDSDIVRHYLVSEIVKAYREQNEDTDD